MAMFFESRSMYMWFIMNIIAERNESLSKSSIYYNKKLQGKGNIVYLVFLISNKKE